MTHVEKDPGVQEEGEPANVRYQCWKRSSVANKIRGRVVRGREVGRKTKCKKNHIDLYSIKEKKKDILIFPKKRLDK